MNSLLKTILDGLTYQDLAGKRQPRLYTIVAGMLLLLASLTSGMAGLNRHLVMSRVQSAPEAVSIPTQTMEIFETEPTGTNPSEEIESSGCPADPAQWSLTPTFISENYQIIQPACVYQGLERTIAWALAVRQGYSRSEATERLGFNDMPMRQIESVTIPAGANGLMDVPVSFIPPHPDFREWRLDARGEAAITYALRGCFKTSSVKGNRLETWGGEYPVICLVVEDAENTHILYSLNGHAYTSPATPMRSYLLFGYLEDGLWAWLGTQTEPKLEITDPQANAKERLTVATLYDSQPWDAEWLSNAHRLPMQPLPEGWQALADESEQQYILTALSGAAE
jgi:hypothetical protein